MSMTDIYSCKDCDAEFTDWSEYMGHRKEHKKDGKATQGGVSVKTSHLSEEDRIELAEQEREVRGLEIAVKKAKLESQLRQLGNGGSNEKTYVLPDGTSFQGTSQDYKEMLSIFYQTQAFKGKDSNKDSSVVELLRQELSELKKSNEELHSQIDNKWKEEVTQKLSYALNKDPITDYQESMQKLSRAAENMGWHRGSNVQDAILQKKSDISAETVTTGLNRIDSRLGQMQKNSDKLINAILPGLSNNADDFIKTKIKKLKGRREGIAQDPSDEEMQEFELKLSNLNTGIEPEVSKKVVETKPNADMTAGDHKISEPLQTQTPPEPAPLQYTGHDKAAGVKLSKEEISLRKKFNKKEVQ